MSASSALDYTSRGWPVFPLHHPVRGGCSCKLGRDCESPAKHPRTPNGLNDATTDVERVRTWWTANPQANVGIRTGVAFDVLDVDGEEGLDSLWQLVSEHGLLPCGPMSRTGKGYHVLFAPTGAGNRTAMLPGLDWRGKGGYIVAPASGHAGGGRYNWSDPSETDADEDVLLEEPWPFPIPLAPEWLVAVVMPPASPPTVYPALPGPGPGPDTGRCTAYASRALEGEVGRVALAPVGQRNHVLNAAAFSLGQLVAGGSLDAMEVAGALLTAASRCGLGEPEAEATIRSGLHAGFSRPRGVSA